MRGRLGPWWVGAVVALGVVAVAGATFGHQSPAKGAQGPLVTVVERAAVPLDTVVVSNGPGDDHLAFKATDGDVITAHFVATRPLAAGAGPCVVAAHGYTGNKDSVPMAALTQAGLGVLSIDLRLHGERGTEAQRRAAGDDPVQLEQLVVRSAGDVRRALDVVATRPECDPKRLGVVGYSLGGYVGALVAANDVRVRAVGLVVTWSGWKGFIDQSDVFLRPLRSDPVAVDKAVAVLEASDPAKALPKISPRPVLLANAASDELVPPSTAYQLQIAARPPSRSLWFPGGHILPDLAQREVAGDLADLLRAA